MAEKDKKEKKEKKEKMPAGQVIRYNFLMLKKIAQDLLGAGNLYYTGHCTGNSQFETMKIIMGESLWNLSTGTVIEI